MQLPPVTSERTQIQDVLQTPSIKGGNHTESERLRNLEATNRRLEAEIGLMREALTKQQEVQFKDNVEHFVRIQELFNKT